MGLLDGTLKQIFGRAFGPLLLDATLVEVTSGSRTPGALTDGFATTTTNHACKGLIETYRDRELSGDIVQVGDRKVTILGDGLTVVPQKGWRVTIEGGTWHIVDVQRDPAGATYIMQVRGP